jgi:hypothetical protein
MEFDGDTFWEVSTWNMKEIRNSCNMVLNTFCPRGVYILRGFSSHQSGAL